ncbi:transglutaminase-like cysteine peptidase [Microvirga guangxiensis]|uniref:Predicted transglutaminase-like cysteine proteinase n=1 Tax=Microvirga guangxiensis TaxID=549386 RepID=A0A1G5JR14_9HYPH|nr:transglutaminase-like cysteine peptidase [Microvirga guangxiensis]SCY90835.1 Predicted transglutaminase-like cysteine proteinase [Microvirga guangxiensis]
MFHPSRLVGGCLLTTLVGLSAAPVAARPSASVALTSERMAQLRQVNNYVNSTIVEVSDLEQYGRADVWALPNNGKGDCEDFALLKRKLLLEQGWPTTALSIAVGATAQGVAHAVLVARTDKGDYVLDNLTSSIRLSHQTGHVFWSYQSGNGWVSASGERTKEPTVDLPVAQVDPGAQIALRSRISKPQFR